MTIWNLPTTVTWHIKGWEPLNETISFIFSGAVARTEKSKNNISCCHGHQWRHHHHHSNQWRHQPDYNDWHIIDEKAKRTNHLLLLSDQNLSSITLKNPSKHFVRLQKTKHYYDKLRNIVTNAILAGRLIWSNNH